MKDGFGREIDYLRISVTDKCNLRCRYCMPEQGVEFMPHEAVLTLEEIFRVVRIMETLGVRKIRFTGGEPLVRKNLVKLIGDVNGLAGIRDIALTTNGVLLKEKIDALKDAGLRRVNISLDTRDRNIFERITGYDRLNCVLESIDAALERGIQVKLNCVPCRELNASEIETLAAFAQEKDVDVRFIELMPIGCGKDFHGISSGEILERLEQKNGTARKAPDAKKGETAQYYLFEGFRGRIGFISPMSHKFCSVCNRVRLTVEGRLKLCLHYDNGIELKPLLREGRSDDEIRECIVEAVKKKPEAHAFSEKQVAEKEDQRKMVQIGG
ncbi:MAG: GTP 3',8-cyclase MoaA [Lachnospiraceae bacterium]|nr:GTP 3',8-cyclase MoaA [Lachnospiraceae bacterium]